MVTKYSGRTGSVKGRTKLVLTYSPTSVKNSTSSVKVTAKLYYESTYRTQDSFNTAKMSGSLGSWSGDMSINGTSVHIKTLSKTVSTSYSGSKKITVNASLSGVEASPGSHSVSASITIPKRPVAKPKAPTNVNMALLSDNRMKTTWSHSATTAQPVTSFTVQYQRLDGGTWTGWTHSATVKGKSYTSNPGTNNKSYRRRVRANNSAGSSGWAYSNYVRMQPYAPTDLRAKVLASGSDIRVTWGLNSPPESTVYKFQIQRRVNGGSWTTINSSFGQIKSKPYTTSYTDTNPGNGSNQYRLKIVNNGEGSDSSWVTSNTVSTIVPPKAPTNLFPDGNVVDFTSDVTFTWQHHDAGDGADQSHYDLRYRAEGESAWTYAPDGGNTSEKSEHLFEGGELENGVNYEWQVKTQGNTKEDYGPWSKSAFVTGWTTPVVAIKDGAPPNPLTALPVPLAWTYSQDEGQGQIGWQARLYSLGSDDMFDSILEEKSAESSSTQTEFTTALTDGGRYGIMVRARSSQGQWSEWSETTFDVELLVPAELRVVLDYNESTGQMNLNITSDEPVQGETAPVVSIDVQRRINGGEWVPIMVGIPFDSETTLVDNIPSIWGVNEYRVTATTEAPSKGVFGPFRKTVTPYVGNTENWLFLNYGETFDYLLRMQGDLSMSGSYERSKETQKLLGRKKPISLLGQQLSREHQVTGTIEFREQCVDDVPDIPAELVGSAFFDDARAWNFSKVQAGPDSQITAEAHYRAKRYGYLMDVPEGNTTDLVSPSPRSGVPGTEIPGREVEEVTARNLWRGSKLSVDRSALATNAWSDGGKQVEDGLEVTITSESAGSQSPAYTNGGYRVAVVAGETYSLAVPVRNSGTVPFPVRMTAYFDLSGWETSGLRWLSPGETSVIKIENMVASNDGTIRFSWRVDTGDPRLPVGGKLTLLDGITLVQDDVAADPFNGDGPISSKHITRKNLAADPTLINGLDPQLPNNYDAVMAGGNGELNVENGWLSIKRNGTQHPTAYLFDTRYKEAEKWAGQTITVGVTLRVDNAPDNPSNSAERRLDFGYVADGSYNYGKATSEQLTEVGETRLTMTATIPENATAWFVRLMGNNADGDDQKTFWKDFTLEYGETDGSFFYGGSDARGNKTYEFEGEPGASASLEVTDEDVLRRNIALDPIGPTVSGQGGLRRSNGGDITVEEDGGRNVLAVRRNTNASESVYIDQGTNFTPPVGTVIHASCWVKVTADTGVGIRLTCSTYNGADRTVAASETINQTVADGWVKHEYTSEVTAMPDGGYIRVLMWPSTGVNTFPQGEGYLVKDFLIEYDTTGPFFAFDTPDTFDRLYRKAPDGSSLELVTDTQSLYRWTGAEANSESEKYLPAAPAHFDEYDEWLNVEPNTAYELSAFVSAPGLRSLARRNLTSQGQFVTNRTLWGSSEVSGAAARWTDDSMFEFGAVELSAMRTGGLVFEPTAYLASGAKASTLGIATLSGTSLTIAADVYAEEAPNDDQRLYIRALDSSGDMIGDVLEHAFRATDAIDRYVMRVTLPEGTESFDLRFSHSATNTIVYASNFTVENDVTDGSWIDDSESGREWVGAENIDSVLLMIESFDSSGESLGTETVAELQPDEFSNRWRTLAGEYVSAVEAATARVWVQWVVNGEHPDLQSDWYFGGMSARVLYTVPERWPGPDSNPDEWRNAQYESTTVCLRTPSGHRVFGAMSGLEITAMEGDLDLAQVSFTVTETDYTENPMVIDESDIWDNIVVDAQDDSLTVQPGEFGTQQGWGNIIVNPYSESDA